MNNSTIPSIMGLIILVLGVGISVLVVNQQQVFRLAASADKSPQDVRVTNITDSSFTISWFTHKKTTGFVRWGTTEQLGNTSYSENPSLPTTTHFITIDNLSPDTTYYFKIVIDGQEFDNSKIAWRIRTGPVIGPPTSSLLVSGYVNLSSGLPLPNATVYLLAGGMSPLSTKTSSNGSFVIPLSNARNANLSSFMAIDPQNTLLEIFVQASPIGVATIQVYPDNANPLPAITLGKAYDLRNQKSPKVSSLPEGNLQLPQESQPQSRFELNENQQ